RMAPHPGRSLYALAALVAGAESSGVTSLRRLQGNDDECKARGARILPTPSLVDYDRCLAGKMSSNSTHDWGIPGAEHAAWADCWCDLNMSQAIEDLSCCQHRSFQQWCGLDCEPDCSSALAVQCIEECPAMCFEAQEYIIPGNLCTRCNPTKCFPVMKCMLGHAENLTRSGELERTCHETDFFDANAVLQKYWSCWQTLPKHSSHWNVLSAFVHCACREGVQALTESTDCCKSVTYGGGICDATCPSEQMCASQDAQTCIHSCNELCPSVDATPSEECKSKCLLTGAECRQYLGCRTPMLTMSNYVCDDGKWPEASTGCCVTNRTNGLGTPAGCPLLCETSKVWRLDGPGIPWWARRSQSVVYQCTCDGCPPPTQEGTDQVKQTLEDNLWDNGQVLLSDIARREGLKLGANRKMQELMLERNELVLELSRTLSAENRPQVEGKIQDINSYYSQLIVQAARTYPDEGTNPDEIEALRQRGQDSDGLSQLLAVLLTVTVIFVLILVVLILVLIQRRNAKQQTPITAFTETDQVVIGSPVPVQAPEGKAEAGLGSERASMWWTMDLAWCCWRSCCHRVSSDKGQIFRLLKGETIIYPGSAKLRSAKLTAQSRLFQASRPWKLPRSGGVLIGFAGVSQRYCTERSEISAAPTSFATRIVVASH
ncbi:unnamed protein product, partial [Effrenium voratum]